MTAFSIILLIVGISLLLLGSVSGYALFSRSISQNKISNDETNIGTLWGLFIIGVWVGLIFIWWALPKGNI